MELFTVHTIASQFQIMWRAGCLANFASYSIFYTFQGGFEEQ